jgi:hypothetical protein
MIIAVRYLESDEVIVVRKELALQEFFKLIKEV